MRLGIVGSEAAKFTPETEKLAKQAICDVIDEYKPTHIVSGRCHLGGVDIWAEEIAMARGLEFIACPPEVRQWDPPGKIGYKKRNEKISVQSDAVVCITLKKLPDGYKGMKFDLCYHCKDPDHVKSGGCWTTRHARRSGKAGWTIAL